jgi:DNA-binding LacI/PurR family transcriptional regulator
VQEKGVAAAKLLIDLIQNQIEGPQRILLKTELIIRESCGVVQRHTTLRNENVQGRG